MLLAHSLHVHRGLQDGVDALLQPLAAQLASSAAVLQDQPPPQQQQQQQQQQQVEFLQAAQQGEPLKQQQQQQQQSAPLPPAPADLSGVWVKDVARSDAAGFEASLDVLGLSGLQRVTERLIEGIEITQVCCHMLCYLLLGVLCPGDVCVLRS